MDTLEYLETQEPTPPLKHSFYLEKAAKSYFSEENPEERLAERVEKHTKWDGEINEIVHYTRKGVTGRDVLINILLSDDEGSTNNKDIVFNYDFQHFGCKIGINNQGEYCVVMVYATHIGDESFTDQRTPGKPMIWCTLVKINFYLVSRQGYSTRDLYDRYKNPTGTYQEEASYEYNVIKEPRHSSRRNIEYDPEHNEIKPVYHPRDQIRLEQTPVYETKYNLDPHGYRKQNEYQAVGSRYEVVDRLKPVQTQNRSSYLNKQSYQHVTRYEDDQSDFRVQDSPGKQFRAHDDRSGFITPGRKSQKKQRFATST